MEPEIIQITSKTTEMLVNQQSIFVMLIQLKSKIYQASLVFPSALSNCKRSVVPSGEPRNDVYRSQQYCQNVYSPDSTAPVYTTYAPEERHKQNNEINDLTICTK